MSASDRRAQSGFGLRPRTVAFVTRAVNLLAPPRLARTLCWLLLLFRPWATAARLERWWRRKLLCQAADRAQATQGSLLRRLHEGLLASGSFDALAAWLAREDRWALAARVEAFARIASLASLRHRLLESGRGPPPLAEVYLASCVDCDLACAGCYSASDRRGVAPDRRRLAALVDEAALSGAVAIHVIGKGEPFLDERRALDLLAVAARRPHLFFSVATNGTHLTEAIAAAAARTPNLLSLVSVDGFERLHDARRGPGTFAKAREAMRLLRERGAPVAFVCTVTSANHREVASRAFVDELREAGCCLGVFSRFFPPESEPGGPWSLPVAELERWTAELDAARRGAGMPLVDLDALEASTGCRARAGLSVYLDGTTGQVSPCIRVPAAPPECRVGDGPAGQLDRALRHPFFEEYRRGACACGTWCGADLAAERAAVAARSRPGALVLD